MYYNEKRKPEKEVANCFAAYFEEKVENIVKSAKIAPDVYKGKTKLAAPDGDFIQIFDKLTMALNA